MKLKSYWEIVLVGKYINSFIVFFCVEGMGNLSDETIRAYDLSARDYKTKVRDLHPYDYSEKFCGYIPSGGLILDLGCGSGRDAKIFSEERGYEVIGVDPSNNMLTIAKENAPNVEFKEMEAESLLFDSGEFDGVWACASLLHLPKSRLPGAIGEVR